MHVFWEEEEVAGLRVAGRRQDIDFQFKYAGVQRLIPAIYHFPQGVAFDLVTVVDEDEMRAFIAKLRDEEALGTSALLRQLTDMHPYQSVPVQDIIVNGSSPEAGWSGRGGMHVQWEIEGEKYYAKKLAYERYLKDASCFACERFFVPAAAITLDVSERKLPRKIERLEIRTHCKTRFIAAEKTFTLFTEHPAPQQIEILHPESKVRHTVYFQSDGLEEIAIPAGAGCTALYGYEIKYEIVPLLPEGQRLEFCNFRPEEERFCRNLSDESAEATDIIGAADGPTSIFIMPLSGVGEEACERGTHGLLLHRCLSVLTRQKTNQAEVILEGIEIQWQQEQSFCWKC